MEIVLALVCVCVAGAAAVFFYKKNAGAESVLKGQADELAALQKAQAVAEERGKAAEAERIRLSGELVKASEELKELRSKLAEAIEERSGLSSKTQELEKVLVDEKGRQTLLKEELVQERERSQKYADEKAELAKKLEGIEKARQEEQKSFEERVAELKDMSKRMEDAFERLSGSALDKSNKRFLELARENLGKMNEQNSAELAKRQQAVSELLKPMQEAMERVGKSVQSFDKNREESFAQMAQRMKSLEEQEGRLGKETHTLAEALRNPRARGAWGEMQLRRVVEFAGLVDHVHFSEQKATSEKDRPDMVVDLPNGLQIVVDSKVPMDAYQRAMGEENEARRKEALKEHARQVRERAKLLGQKKYTDQLENAPDFTVLFMPSEALFSAALSIDPELLDFGIKNRIVIATPTTLIALLMTVATGWENKMRTQNVQELADECKELYGRVCTFLETYAKVGKALGTAIESYNKSVGSMERRLLPQARKMNELGGFDKDKLSIDKAAPRTVAEETPRALNAPEVEE